MKNITKLIVLAATSFALGMNPTNSSASPTTDVANAKATNPTFTAPVPDSARNQPLGTTSAPAYKIYDIGVIEVGGAASQGLGASTGGIAVGRSFNAAFNASQGFTWTLASGLVGLPNLSGRNFCVSNSANDNGMVVGTGATSSFGSGRLPVVWQNGVVSQLPLPSGQTLGDANHVNASGVAVGSVNSGISQRAVIYSGGSAAIVTQTTSGGSYFTTAYGINDSGRIVGPGIDPNNAARNVGMVYDIGSSSAVEVGALPDANGAIAFGVSNSGFVTGSSMMNQGSGLPFVWSAASGMVAIPLAIGTSQGSGRAVNSAGWVVGNDSSAFSIPFLYDGSATYRLQDLIPAGTGWDLSMNTSSSALGISDNGVIVGTGLFNGATHAYAMIPAFQLSSAASRKVHAGAGTFDIPLPLSGTPGIECRSGGATNDYTLVFTFTNNVASGNASVSAGTGSVSGSPVVTGKTMTVNLTGVTDIQTLTVALSSVTDIFSQAITSTAVSVGFLIGDVNANGMVNASDIGLTKSQSGIAVTSANFRADINAGGTVNGSDVSQVKATAGHNL